MEPDVTYEVTFFYHATGMESCPDSYSCGTVEAASPDEAKDIIAHRRYPVDEAYGPQNAWSTRDFFRGCLSAKALP